MNITLSIVATAVLATASVSLWTLRVALTARNRKLLAAFAASVEATVFALAFSRVLAGLHSGVHVVAYAAGVAVGTVVGLTINDRLRPGRSPISTGDPTPHHNNLQRTGATASPCLEKSSIAFLAPTITPPPHGGDHMHPTITNKLAEQGHRDLQHGADRARLVRGPEPRQAPPTEARLLSSRTHVASTANPHPSGLGASFELKSPFAVPSGLSCHNVQPFIARRSGSRPNTSADQAPPTSSNRSQAATADIR